MPGNSACDSHPAPKVAVTSGKPVVHCWWRRVYWCYAAISDDGCCGVRVLSTGGLLMFRVQRLSVRLASHGAGMRVAPFAFGLELRLSCAITTRRSRT